MGTLVAREITGYMRSILKRLPPEAGDRFLQRLVDEYPCREHLLTLCRLLLGRIALPQRVIRALDRRRGAAKRMSKYDVATRLHAFLS